MSKKRKTLREKLAYEILTATLNKAIDEAVSGNLSRAEELGKAARRIAMMFNIRIPKKYKLFFCRKCKSFIFPGKTARIRFRRNRFPHISITCLKCHGIKRIPIKHNEL